MRDTAESHQHPGADIYFLFICGCAGSLLLCTGVLWLPCKQGPLFGTVPGLLTAVASLAAEQGHQSPGSVTVMFSSSPAFANLPDGESNLCPLHRRADSQPLDHQGSPQGMCFLSPKRGPARGHQSVHLR